jgi:hypothetical protein
MKTAMGLLAVVLILACGGLVSYQTRARLEQQDRERAVVYIDSRQQHPVVRIAVEGHNLAMAIDEHYLGPDVGQGAVESRVEAEIRSRADRLQQSIKELQAMLGSNLKTVLAIRDAASRIGHAYQHDADHKRMLNGEYKHTIHTFTCNRPEVGAGARELIEVAAQLGDLESYNHIETLRAAKALSPGEGPDLSDYQATQLQQTLASWPVNQLLIGYRYLLLANRRAQDTAPVEEILAEVESYPALTRHKSYQKQPDRHPKGYIKCRSVHSAADMLVKRYRQIGERLELLSTTTQKAIHALDDNDYQLLGDLSIMLLEHLGEETTGRRTWASRFWWPIGAGAATSLAVALLVIVTVRVSRRLSATRKSV